LLVKSWRLLLAVLTALLVVVAGVAPALGDMGSGTVVQLNEDNNNQAVTVNRGVVVELSLPSNPTTGYAWSFNSNGGPDRNILSETSHFEIGSSLAVGSGGAEYWVFRAAGAGTAEINLAYARPWETGASPAKSYGVTIGVNSSSAAPAQLNQSSFTVGSDAYAVNGQSLQMDGAPFLQGGRVYVPVRGLAAALGLTNGDLYWDAASRSVVLPPNQDGVVYHLKIGDSNIYRIDPVGKDNVAQTMDAAPLDSDGHIYLPARFIAGLFGYQVGWNAAAGVLSIEPGN
jgi:predicted secreted protein